MSFSLSGISAADSQIQRLALFSVTATENESEQPEEILINSATVINKQIASMLNTSITTNTSCYFHARGILLRPFVRAK